MAEIAVEVGRERIVRHNVIIFNFLSCCATMFKRPFYYIMECISFKPFSSLRSPRPLSGLVLDNRKPREVNFWLYISLEKYQLQTPKLSKPRSSRRERKYLPVSPRCIPNRMFCSTHNYTFFIEVFLRRSLST